MGQIPPLETDWRSLNPKLPYSITPALSVPKRSAIGNQSLALSVVLFICAALRSARARSVARFAPLEPIRRESPSLNSRLRLRIELSADSFKSYIGQACNSLNSFSCHVDR